MVVATVGSPERPRPASQGPFIPDNTGILLSRNPRIERAVNLDLSSFLPPFNLQGRDYLRSKSKRALDIAIALPSALGWIPASILAGYVMSGENGFRMWPFTRQRRFGLENVRFDMYKIRSQTIDTSATGVITPTRVGAFLRKTSIDELPQMLNVLDGSMSFVGRRPIYPIDLKNLSRRLLVDMPFEIAQAHFDFTKDQWDEDLLDADMVDNIRNFASLVKTEAQKVFDRFKVNDGAQPGVTGLYQVLGRRSIPPEDRARLDLLYDERASILLDVAIIMATPNAVLSRNGAR